MKHFVKIGMNFLELSLKKKGSFFGGSKYSNS